VNNTFTLLKENENVFNTEITFRVGHFLKIYLMFYLRNIFKYVVYYTDIPC